MKTLVIFPLILCIVQAADKPDVKAKTTPSPSNTIPQNPKYETVYQQIKYQQPLQQMQQQIQLQPVQLQPVQHLPNQQKSYYIPMQFIQQKPYYVPQTTPHAMIIIAQPALVPQSLLYGSPTQQLLNYFQSNPQAKYQLLHGNYPQQPHQIQPNQIQPHQIQPQPAHQAQVQPTATYMHPVLASPVGNYIFTPQIAPQPQLVSHASPLPAPAVYSTQQPQLHHVQPTQLSSLSHHQTQLAHHQPQLAHHQPQLAHHQPQLAQHQPQLTHLTPHQPQLTHLTQHQPQLTHVPHQPQLTHVPHQPPQQYSFNQQHPSSVSTPATTTVQQQQQQQPQQQQPQLSSLAQLAQLAAQQYASSPMKSAPAIVTGFENFTPEQQAQIKTQLNNHLGTNYHAVANPNSGQYSSKYAAEQNNANFSPSPQVTKNNEPVTTTSNAQIGDILKTRYVKGKN